MAWLLLAGAIATEVVATTALKLSDGLTRVPATGVVVVGYLLSFFLMSRTLKYIDIGVTYAIWGGVGTAAIAVIGMVAFGESSAWPRFVFLALILAGVLGLQLTGTTTG